MQLGADRVEGEFTVGEERRREEERREREGREGVGVRKGEERRTEESQDLGLWCHFRLFQSGILQFLVPAGVCRSGRKCRSLAAK